MRGGGGSESVMVTVAVWKSGGTYTTRFNTRETQ